MIVVRHTFQAKYGKGDALVDLAKEYRARPDTDDGRILVDLSGTFFTVVIEQEFASLGAYETQLEAQMADAAFAPWFAEWFGRMSELVETGDRQYFRIVD